jgi:hypothetical protein
VVGEVRGEVAGYPFLGRAGRYFALDAGSAPSVVMLNGMIDPVDDGESLQKKRREIPVCNF